MPDEKSENEEKVEEKEVDYQKELEETTAQIKRAEDARKGYEIRHQKADNIETATVEEVETEAEKEERLADKVVAKMKPIIQSSLESSTFDKKLSELAGSNPSLRELIKLHFDKSTNPNLPIEDRLDFAYAIANKKVIAKTIAEINIAQKNRQQISGVGQGVSTEDKEIPGANDVSRNQISDLTKRADVLAKQLNWSPEIKKKFIDDAVKNLSRPIISR